METRSQTQGKPLKKPGAYDTGKYYQEMDQGYGDVGVDQEPDAGQLDNPEDADFNPSRADLDAAAATVQEDVPADENDVRGELQDLKPTGTGPAETDERGEPVPVVQESGEEVEANDAGTTLAP